MFGSPARRAAFATPGEMPPLRQFLGLAEDLETPLGREVGLAERKAVENSRNYIRRNALKGALLQVARRLGMQRAKNLPAPSCKLLYFVLPKFP
jgi:hypothetical protein